MNNIRFFLLISLMLLGNAVLMAQTPVLQTAKESWGEEGDVIYSYYVAPNGDEVKQGSFKLTRSDKLSNGGTYLRAVSGNFKNGYKDGIWTYTHNRKDYGSNNYYATGLVKLVQSFKEGVPHGLWSYNCNVKYRQLLRNGSGYSWGEYVDPELVNVSCSYNNGKISGKLIYKTDKHDFSGNFNSNGYCIGDWLIREGSESTRFTSKNGFLTMYNQKGVNATLSGVINFTPQVISLIDSINAGTLSVNEIPKRGLQVNTIDLSNVVMDLYTYMNGAHYFPMYLLGKGDKTYKEGDSSERSYGEFMIIKPQEDIPLYTIDEYNSISRSSDHKNGISRLNDFLKKYEKRLSDSDKKRVFSEIAEHKRLLEFEEERKAKETEELNEKKTEKEYKELYAEMDKLPKPSKKQRKKTPSEYSQRNFIEYGYLKKEYPESQCVSEDYNGKVYFRGKDLADYLYKIGSLRPESYAVSLPKLKEYITYLKQFPNKK